MTAVQWLVEQLEERGHIIPDHIEETSLIKEKQQIIDAWFDGYGGSSHSEDEYYNETYGSKINQALRQPPVISSVCTCRNAELEKDSLVPVYCHNCNAMCKLTYNVAEKYGSKGSDNSPKVQNKDSFGGTSSQTEISDEMSKIEKALYHTWSDYEYKEGNLYSTTFRDGWLMGIDWYKKQLNNK